MSVGAKPLRQERPQTRNEKSAEAGGQTPRRKHELPTGDTRRCPLFNGVLASTLLSQCANQSSPEGSNRRTLILFALSTQLSRVITKDKITAAFRAPSTPVKGKAVPASWRSVAAVRACAGRLAT